MADDKSTDVLMMFMVTAGNPVPAECRTQFSGDDASPSDFLMKDFKPGYFFEAQDIDLDFSAGNKTKQSTTQTSATEMGEVTITRQIDRASPLLMDYCFKCTSLHSASIVKRRASGHKRGAAGMDAESGAAYLRLDFQDVLLTKVNWSDSHVVKEKFSFVCRSFQMVYRPQSGSGVLGSKIPSQKWSLFT